MKLLVALQKCCSSVWTLTCAHKISRVRAPPLVCSTHCCHPLSWNKPWVTHERYLSSLSCVLIWFNGTIHRRSGITTVDWREGNGEYKSVGSPHMSMFANNALLGGGVRVRVWIREQRKIKRRSKALLSL